ncbi:MAG: preprotein translocase subunit SecE [Candidatus Parcubacteria bacterium]|jgi:preprotein translocase SecE subunit|nr:preprotein translocase subunit SecE [Candidatus Parcubacteria bacterium]
MVNVFSAIKKYLVESRQELKKVTWPDRISLTKTFFQVLLIIVIFALIFLVVDKLLSWGVSLL